MTITITSICGILHAEYMDETTGERILRDLSDAGLDHAFEYGDSFEIDEAPYDEWELEDKLREIMYLREAEDNGLFF